MAVQRHLLRSGSRTVRRVAGGAAAAARPDSVTLQALQVGEDVCGILVTEVAVLLQRLADNTLELGRQSWIQSEG